MNEWTQSFLSVQYDELFHLLDQAEKQNGMVLLRIVKLRFCGDFEKQLLWKCQMRVQKEQKSIVKFNNWKEIFELGK